VSSPPKAETGLPSPPPDTPLLLGVEEGYERWAPNYDHTPNPVIAREERYLVSLLPSLHGKNVLDLACGTGRWLERLLACGASFGAGVDCSNAMLRVATRKTSLCGKLAQADCLELPFGPSVFDLAVCSFAVGHIQDLRRMARQLAWVMKPGGDVFVTDLHPDAYAGGWRTGFRDARGAVYIRVFPRLSEEIVRAFFSAGFECLTHVSLCLGEAEKPIFVSANKQNLFEELCRTPAVLVCRFRRCNTTDQERL
jgi:ubiquinone/menaquinone biosynthesis C-methylase UbiE